MEFPGLTDIQIENLIPKDGKLEYVYPFMRKDYLQELIEQVQWKQDEIKMFGKVMPLPRLTAWYGDSNAAYTYSGITNKPLQWSPLLLKLKSAVEDHCKTKFNSVLLNYYRDGSDHMSWHCDNERELGKNPVIASLSFGAKRKFQFKHKNDKGTEVVSIEPDSDSLIIMKGTIQEYWNHRITKTAKPIGPRVNLTFRSISL